MGRDRGLHDHCRRWFRRIVASDRPCFNRRLRRRRPTRWIPASQPPPPSGNLHYSLWYFSTDRSTISLRMQERRRHRSATVTAEKVFGTVLRDIRKEQGFTQETLGFASGYHATYIGQLERGQKSPSLRTIIDLASTLNTHGSEMLRRVEVRLARAMADKPPR